MMAQKFKRKNGAGAQNFKKWRTSRWRKLKKPKKCCVPSTGKIALESILLYVSFLKLFPSVKIRGVDLKGTVSQAAVLQSQSRYLTPLLLPNWKNVFFIIFCFLNSLLSMWELTKRISQRT